jgi:hypothetical protein
MEIFLKRPNSKQIVVSSNYFPDDYYDEIRGLYGERLKTTAAQLIKAKNASKSAQQDLLDLKANELQLRDALKTIESSKKFKAKKLAQKAKDKPKELTPKKQKENNLPKALIFDTNVYSSFSTSVIDDVIPKEAETMSDVPKLIQTQLNLQLLNADVEVKESKKEITNGDKTFISFETPVKVAPKIDKQVTKVVIETSTDTLYKEEADAINIFIKEYQELITTNTKEKDALIAKNRDFAETKSKYSEIKDFYLKSFQKAEYVQRIVEKSSEIAIQQASEKNDQLDIYRPTDWSLASDKELDDLASSFFINDDAIETLDKNDKITLLEIINQLYHQAGEISVKDLQNQYKDFFEKQSDILKQVVLLKDPALADNNELIAFAPTMMKAFRQFISEKNIDTTNLPELQRAIAFWNPQKRYKSNISTHAGVNTFLLYQNNLDQEDFLKNDYKNSLWAGDYSDYFGGQDQLLLQILQKDKNVELYKSFIKDKEEILKELENQAILNSKNGSLIADKYAFISPALRRELTRLKIKANLIKQAGDADITNYLLTDNATLLTRNQFQKVNNFFGQIARDMDQSRDDYSEFGNLIQEIKVKLSTQAQNDDNDEIAPVIQVMQTTAKTQLDLLENLTEKVTSNQVDQLDAISSTLKNRNKKTEEEILNDILDKSFATIDRNVADLRQYSIQRFANNLESDGQASLVLTQMTKLVLKPQKGSKYKILTVEDRKKLFQSAQKEAQQFANELVQTVNLDQAKFESEYEKFVAENISVFLPNTTAEIQPLSQIPYRDFETEFSTLSEPMVTLISQKKGFLSKRKDKEYTLEELKEIEFDLKTRQTAFRNYSKRNLDYLFKNIGSDNKDQILAEIKYEFQRSIQFQAIIDKKLSLIDKYKAYLNQDNLKSFLTEKYPSLKIENRGNGVFYARHNLNAFIWFKNVDGTVFEKKIVLSTTGEEGREVKQINSILLNTDTKQKFNNCYTIDDKLQLDFLEISEKDEKLSLRQRLQISNTSRKTVFSVLKEDKQFQRSVEKARQTADLLNQTVGAEAAKQIIEKSYGDDAAAAQTIKDLSEAAEVIIDQQEKVEQMKENTEIFGEKVQNELQNGEIVVEIQDDITANLTSMLVQLGITVSAPLIATYISTAILPSFGINSAIVGATSIAESSIFGNILWGSFGPATILTSSLKSIFLSNNSKLLGEFLNAIIPDFLKNIQSNETEFMGTKVREISKGLGAKVKGSKYFAVKAQEYDAFKKKLEESRSKTSAKELFRRALTFFSKGGLNLFVTIGGALSNPLGFYKYMIFNKVIGTLLDAVDGKFDIFKKIDANLKDSIDPILLKQYESCQALGEKAADNSKCAQVQLLIQNQDPNLKQLFFKLFKNGVQNGITELAVDAFDMKSILNYLDNTTKSVDPNSIFGSAFHMVNNIVNSTKLGWFAIENWNKEWIEYVNDTKHDLKNSFWTNLGFSKLLSKNEQLEILKQVDTSSDLDVLADPTLIKRLDGIKENFNGANTLSKLSFAGDNATYETVMDKLSDSGLLTSDNDLFAAGGFKNVYNSLKMREIQRDEMFAAFENGTAIGNGVYIDQLNRFLLNAKNGNDLYHQRNFKLSQGTDIQKKLFERNLEFQRTITGDPQRMRVTNFFTNTLKFVRNFSGSYLGTDLSWMVQKFDTKEYNYDLDKEEIDVKDSVTKILNRSAIKESLTDGDFVNSLQKEQYEKKVKDVSVTGYIPTQVVSKDNLNQMINQAKIEQDKVYNEIEKSKSISTFDFSESFLQKARRFVSAFKFLSPAQIKKVT